jgi:hypothetical protein
MLAFDLNDIADRGLRMYRRNQPIQIRLVGLSAIVILVGLLARGGRALAQSMVDSSARASNSAVTENASAPGVESANDDTSDAPADADEAITPTRIDDARSHSADNSGLAYVPSDSAADSDEASSSSAENGGVLELPQVVNPSTGTINRPPDGTLAQAEGDDDDTAQSDQVGQDPAADRDLAAMADQVGTLEDYEDHVAEVPPGTIFFAPVTVVRIPPPPLFNPALRPRFGVPLTPRIILPPTSSGPFPSTSPMLMPTSPMLMTPRLATFGLFRGGSFRRGHR